MDSGTPWRAPSAYAPPRVSADDLHAGVLHEPCSQGLGFSISGHVDGRVPLQIREDSAVSLATPNGPVIHSEYARGQDVLLGRLPHALQNRPRSAREPHRHCQTLARQAAKRKADELERSGGPPRTPRVRHRGLREAFGEYEARAARRVAEELAYMSPDSDSHAVLW